MAADGWKKEAGTYAVFETEMGTITCKLLPEKAPETVANFVGLAEGTKEFTDPRTLKKVKKPYYDGTIFHRAIARFMIQGGDPLGTGMGGPGFTIPDEVWPGQTYDVPGKLAMAKTSAPNSGGSQFFITVHETKFLDDGYTMFGVVVEGQSVADAISKLPTSGPPNDRPLTPPMLKKVTIVRVK